MESANSVLQLYKPIMELCYVSFYLPSCNVRGFAYKRCVTRDQAGVCFDNCIRVREETEQAQHKDPPYGSLSEALKKTATRDLLTELYKLTAAKDKLLVDLLHTVRNPGSKMGNQDGKFEDLPESSHLVEGSTLLPNDFHESLTTSVEKRASLSKGNKGRRFSRRKDGIEDHVNKKIKWKGTPEMGVAQGREKTPSIKISWAGSVDNLLRPRLQSLENKDGYVSLSAKYSGSKYSELSGMLGAESAASSSQSLYDNDVFSDFTLLPQNGSPMGDLQGVLKIMQEQRNEHTLPKRSSLEQDESDQSSGGKVIRTVIAKMQDLSPCVQKVTTYSFSEDSLRDDSCDNVTVLSGVPSEFVPQADVLTLQEPVESNQGVNVDREKKTCLESLADGEMLRLNGFVNKTLLKVLKSDSVEESEYWLGQMDGRGAHGRISPNLMKQISSLESLSSPATSQKSKLENNSTTPPVDSVELIQSLSNGNSKVVSPLSSQLPSPNRYLPLPIKHAHEDPGTWGREVRWAAPPDFNKPQLVGCKARASSLSNLASESCSNGEYRIRQSENGKVYTLQSSVLPPGVGIARRHSTRSPLGSLSDLSKVFDTRQNDHQARPSRNPLHLTLDLNGIPVQPKNTLRDYVQKTAPMSTSLVHLESLRETLRN